MRRVRGGVADDPVLIVGGGLAGTALAWRLRERGAPFVIVDPDEPGTCSRIAAGLVTPITGRRVKPSWRIAEFLPEAMEFYRRVGGLLGASLYHPLPLARLFNERREAEWWRGRTTEPDLARWVDAGAPLPDPGSFHGEFGGFVQRGAGWLDTSAYLDGSREWFKREGSWRRALVRDEDLGHDDNGVSWGGGTFSHAVLCRGAQERLATRFFTWLRFECAKGVIGTMHLRLPEWRIVNRGCWLLPTGADTWRAGATYEWDLATPMQVSLAHLEGKLSRLLRVPFAITGPQAGIRPIVHQRQLVLGRHPAHSRVCLFNGLGSKGVLRAPFFARMLVEHLLDGRPIEPGVDVRSND